MRDGKPSTYSSFYMDSTTPRSVVYTIGESHTKKRMVYSIVKWTDEISYGLVKMFRKILSRSPSCCRKDSATRILSHLQ